MLEMNNRNGLLFSSFWNMQRGRHVLGRPGSSQVWMSSHPTGKVIVPVGSHVYLSGSVCDPARRCGHLPPSMAVSQPIEPLGDWNHLTLHWWESHNHKPQLCQGIHCSALFSLLKWMGAWICMFVILWIMLNLHCFCNSEIYVLVLGVFPSIVWKWRLASQGRKLAPALAFPPVQVNSSCFALLDLHFTCIFLCYCNTQQLWRVMPAGLCWESGRSAQSSFFGRIKPITCSQFLQRNYITGTFNCLHSSNGGFTLSPWSCVPFIWGQSNISDMRSWYICLNYLKNHKIMKLEGIFWDIECSIHKALVLPGI